VIIDFFCRPGQFAALVYTEKNKARKKPVISGNLQKRRFQVRRKVPHRPDATGQVAIRKEPEVSVEKAKPREH